MTNIDPIVFVVGAAVPPYSRSYLSSSSPHSYRESKRSDRATAEFLNAKRPAAPACLVLDVRLPDVSGLEFQRDLAQANVKIPIIFITGHADIPMTVRAMKAGAVEFLTKPFRGQELLDAIQDAISKDRAAWHERLQMNDLLDT